MTGGGKKSESGRGKPMSDGPAKAEGRKGGRGLRPPLQFSLSASARTRHRGQSQEPSASKARDEVRAGNLKCRNAP